MPVQNVRAEVIDLRRDRPSPSDQFVVDTNSWKELTYSRMLRPKPDYQDFIKKALLEGATLFSCGVTLVELASVIEQNEWELYKRTVATIERKDFRHDCPAERVTVLEEISAAWAQIAQVARLIEINLNSAATDRMMTALRMSLVDGYDTVLVEAMTRRGVFDIITDDGDFSTVPDIRVFTANLHVLSVAKRQGQLRTRC